MTDNDVNEYARAGDLYRKNHNKFKKTGKDKFKKRADHYRDIKKAIGIKLGTTTKNTNNTNIKIQNSFNKKKTLRINASAKVNVSRKKKP